MVRSAIELRHCSNSASVASPVDLVVIFLVIIFWFGLKLFAAEHVDDVRPCQVGCGGYPREEFVAVDRDVTWAQLFDLDADFARPAWVGNGPVVA